MKAEVMPGDGRIRLTPESDYERARLDVSQNPADDAWRVLRQPYGTMLGPIMVTRDETGRVLHVDYLPEKNPNSLNADRDAWRAREAEAARIARNAERVRGLLVHGAPVECRESQVDGPYYAARTTMGLVQCARVDESSRFHHWRARWWPAEGQPGIDLAHGPTPEDALRGADKRLRQIREAVR